MKMVIRDYEKVKAEMNARKARAALTFSALLIGWRLGKGRPGNGRKSYMEENG